MLGQFALLFSQYFALAIAEFQLYSFCLQFRGACHEFVVRSVFSYKIIIEAYLVKDIAFQLLLTFEHHSCTTSRFAKSLWLVDILKLVVHVQIIIISHFLSGP